MLSLYSLQIYYREENSTMSNHNSSILQNLLQEALDRKVRVIFTNGFQLRGILKKFDSTHLMLDSSRYAEYNTAVIAIDAIATFVPEEK